MNSYPSPAENQAKVLRYLTDLDAYVPPKLGLSINAMEKPYSVVGDGSADDTERLQDAADAVAYSDASASGEVIFTGFPRLTDTLTLGRDDAFTGVSLRGPNGLIGGLRYDGPVDGRPALKINRGRYNNLRRIFIENVAGSRGTSVGILETGPNVDLQTTGIVAEQVVLRGFNRSWMPGDPGVGATGSAGDQNVYIQVSFEDCDEGFYANSNFNIISLNFLRCSGTRCGRAFYFHTAGQPTMIGCAGASNTIDIECDAGNNLSMVGWDSENSETFLKLSDGAAAHLAGVIQLRDPVLSRDDAQGLIELQSAFLSIEKLRVGPQFTGAGAAGPCHVIRVANSPSFVELGNWKCGDNYPLFIPAGNGGADGSRYEIGPGQVVHNSTGAVISTHEPEAGVVIWPRRVALGGGGFA